MEIRKSKKKEWMLFGCIIASLAAVLMIPALAKEEQKDSAGIVVPETVIASGDVTDSVTWKVTEDDAGTQTLVIGGSGPMADYKGQSEQPWQPWKATSGSSPDTVLPPHCGTRRSIIRICAKCRVGS